MNRHAMTKLREWKQNPDRSPLILRGARQVGKTWLMKEFGKSDFTSVAYINFDHNARMKTLFAGDFNVDRILAGLSAECEMEINPDETLILLDEIQEVPEAITALKYFREDTRHRYFIIAAGSLLGIALRPGNSFPVGKTESLNLYPLSFGEFLEAAGSPSLVHFLRDCDFSMMSVFREKYIDLLKKYYFIGGMPAAVNAYLSTGGDTAAVRKVQSRLLDDYARDFSKHAQTAMIPRLNLVWNGIPSQLGKENKKFIYSVLREGARAREYETAIQWLLDCGLCLRVPRVTKGGIPLKSYQDPGAFKLFLADVGLLSAMADLDARTLLEGNRIFSEFKGSLTEQFICQEIVSELELQPYYWSAEASNGEVDFVLQHCGQVLPVEVKAEENLNAKSLKVFISKFDLPFGIRTSMSDYRKEERIINLPLYAFSCLLRAVENVSASNS